MRCKRCGEIIDVGEGRCRRCGEKARAARTIESPPSDRAPRGSGLLYRIFRALLPRFESTRFAARICNGPNVRKEYISESYSWHDSTTGETQCWDRWEDVPPEIQAKIDSMRGRFMPERGPGSHDADHVVTDSTGDLAALPPDLRKHVQQLIDAGHGPASEITIRTIRDTDFAVTDESGVTRRYETLEEMPPEVRARFEQAMREHGEP